MSEQITDKERLPQIENYIGERLAKLESVTSLAVVKFLLLDPASREKLRPFLNNLSSLNKQMTKNLNDLRENAYRNRIIPTQRRLEQLSQYAAVGAAKDMRSFERRNRSTLENLKSLIRPKDVRSESKREPQQRIDGKQQEVNELLDTLQRANRDHLNLVIEDAFGHLRGRAEGDLSTDKALAKVATALLNKVFPEMAPEGEIFEYIRNFCPDAAETKRQKWLDSVASASPVSPTSTRSEQFLAPAAPGGPPRSVSNASSVASSQERASPGGSVRNSSIRTGRDSHLSHLYEQMNNCEDEFTSGELISREVGANEKIAKIESSIAAVQECERSFAGASDSPDTSRASAGIHEAIKQTAKDLTDTRLRIYNRLQKPQAEGRLNEETLLEIGEAFAFHTKSKLSQLNDMFREHYLNTRTEKEA